VHDDAGQAGTQKSTGDGSARATARCGERDDEDEPEHDAAERRETHELTHFCLEVAQLFSAFYRDCRVLPDEPAEIPLSQARLALTAAARQVLANALGLLGISAPDSM